MNNERPKSLFVVSSLFVTALIISNIIAVKPASFWGVTLPSAVIIFPISYILGDVLTEVYGYSTAKRVIWLGFLCNLLAVTAIMIAQILPGAAFWDAQEAFERILGFTPRLLIASFAAYLIGEITNASTMSHLKKLTRGRFLWIRTIGSTLVGQGLDSLVFLTIAFAGTFPLTALFSLILNQWLFKVTYEVLATPFTYAAVAYLKRIEETRADFLAIPQRER